MESLREKREGQTPRTFPFRIMGFVKPVHAQKWQGQRMVLGAYLGARYNTGGGCLVYPVSFDSTSPWYDVNVLFPLLMCPVVQKGALAVFAFLMAPHVVVKTTMMMMMMIR